MKPNMKKKIVNMLLGMLCLLCACGNGEAVELSENSLVRIEAQGGIGSGVIYALNEEELIVLTAAHVVEAGEGLSTETENGGSAEETPDEKGATIYFSDGSAVECEDILCSEITDLARLKISGEAIPERVLNSCVAAVWDKESFDKLQAEDGCVARGYGDGELVCKEGTILNSWIYVEDYEQYMIWAQGEILPGMSGGGLFDREGRLLGILSGGSSDGELVAVPLSLILQFSQSGW